MAREMKDSGIAWIGEIPKNWKEAPIFVYFNENTKKNLFLERKTALKFTYGSIVRKENFDVEDEYVEKTIKNYTIVNLGDIVINGLNLNFDFVSQRVGLVKEEGAITSSYIIITPRKDLISPIFATYLYKTFDNFKAFHNMGDGVRKILNFSELKKEKFFCPSYSEQQCIANFLDSKCSEIDSLTNDISKEIELLKEYRKSVIYEAVTKGLDPNVEMKESEIEWIGMIPAHWNIHRVSNYFYERNSKNSLCLEQNLLSLSFGKIVRKDINTNGGLLPTSFSTYNIIEPLDIIIRPTDLQNDKKSLRTGLSYEHGIITSAYITLAPKENINSEYFHYLLHSYDIEKVFYNMGNGVRQGLNYNEFARLLVIEPPLEEQKTIVSYLKCSCSEIDSIIASKQEQIDKLKEYKKSLIYEYVTGKKEVPAV